MNPIVLIVLAYFIGSIPFALVIGKGFYHIDVREYGSGNPGASNTGRVLGMAAGAAVMILDAAKVFAVVVLAACCCDDKMIPLGGLAAAIGHCYPVFARFKGGKAVASVYGFLFGLFAVGGFSPWVFFLPLASFIGVLYVTKTISLASMISAVIAVVYVYCTSDSALMVAVLLAMALLILFRHRENIQRIWRGEEHKITWM